LANCILTINELSEEKTQTSILLFKQKSKSEQLAAELSNIHKQLEMKSQEIATAKVEAITQLKLASYL
jgi:molecular chaperone GrpE (heat shock protein)